MLIGLIRQLPRLSTSPRSMRAIVLVLCAALLAPLFAPAPAAAAEGQVTAQVARLLGERTSAGLETVHGRNLDFALSGKVAEVLGAAQVRDCLYDNSCPEQVGNEEGGTEAPPPTPVPTPTPDPRDYEAEAYAEALIDLNNWFEDVVPVFQVWPDGERQHVELESFLFVHNESWTPHSFQKSVHGEWARITATPVQSRWLFTQSSDGAEHTELCAQGDEWAHGQTDATCGRTFKHSSAVTGGVQLEVFVKYELRYSSSLQGTSTGSFLPLSPNGLLEERESEPGTTDLLVNEALTYGFLQDAELPGTAGERPSAKIEPSPECSTAARGVAGGIKWFTAWQFRPSCESVQTVFDVVTNFAGGCFDGVAGRIGDLAELVKAVVTVDVDFFKEQVAGAKDLLELAFANPAEFARTVGYGFLELDPENLPEGPEEWASWAGSFLCGLAFDYITGKLGDSLVRRLKRYTNGDLPDPDAPNTPRPCRYSSFPTGTPVLMADGTRKSINQIEVGDEVISYNFTTDSWEPRTVLDKWSYVDRGAAATATLTDGTIITATADHRFWVTNTEEWTELQDVEANDELGTPSGPTVVTDVALADATPWIVWELTIEGNHNFTVHSGTSDLLVHNQDPGGTSVDDLNQNFTDWVDGGGNPNDWFDNLSLEQVDAVVNLPKNRDSSGRLRDHPITDRLKSGLRNSLGGAPGGMHEFFPVSQARHLKQLGLSAADIHGFAMPTDNFVAFDPDTGAAVTHGRPHATGSGRYHNELIAAVQDVIDNGGSAQDMLDAIDGVNARWGVIDVPGARNMSQEELRERRNTTPRHDITKDAEGNDRDLRNRTPLPCPGS